MPQTAVAQTFGATYLMPLYNGEDAVTLPVNLAPSTAFPQGTVLGVVTGSANDVQTITPPGSGTYTLTITNPLTGRPGTTTALAFGANDAAVLAAIQAVLNATGGGTAAVAALAVTFSGLLAAQPVPPMTASAGSVAHTTVGRTANTYRAYASGSSDGSQVPRAILMHDCATDAAGNVTVGSQVAGASPWGETHKDAPAYISGYFDTTKLVGLDANAVAASVGWAKLISGTAAAGVVCVTGS